MAFPIVLAREQLPLVEVRHAVRGPVRVLNDGEVIELGAVSLTAHFTPGHTLGGITWTWRSCEGEVAFLANLRAGETTFEGESRGLLYPEECMVEPARLREMGRSIAR